MLSDKIIFKYPIVWIFSGYSSFLLYFSFFLSFQLCVCVGVCVCESRCLEASSIWCPEAGVTGDCEPPDMGAGNCTWALCKSTQSSHLHKPFSLWFISICAGSWGHLQVVKKLTQSSMVLRLFGCVLKKIVTGINADLCRERRQTERIHHRLKVEMLAWD